MKFKLKNQTIWGYHFFGWGNAIDCIKKLHSDYGVLFLDYMDDIIAFKEISEPFVGFFHHTPESPTGKYYEKLKGLNHYLESKIWKKNEKKCKGIYTLSLYNKNFIKNKTECNVDSLYHPIPDNVNLFSLEKYKKNKSRNLYHPGNWLRDLNSFKKLKTNRNKIISKHWKEISLDNPDIDSSIYCMGYISKEEYDKFTSENIIFQCYYDVSASNTILECIGKNTPIILNRLPAAEEYLGKEYPLFFNTLEEASFLCEDENLIEEAHFYLKNMDKTIFSKKYFLQSIIKSNIYQNLKKIFI